MGNQQVAINQSQKPIEGYRGVLIHTQEYGYKLITVMNIVDATSIEEYSPFLWLDVMKARERLRELQRQSLDQDHDVRS